MAGGDSDLEADVGRAFGIVDQTQGDQGTSDQGSDDQGDQGEGGAQPSADGQQDDAQQGQQQNADGKKPGDQPDERDNYIFGGQKPQRDAKGALRDAKGNVIAETPRERQLAYNLNRTQHAATQYRLRAERVEQQMQQYAAIRDMQRQHNLQPQDVMEAVSFRARFNSDPVSALRDIVGRVLGTTNLTMEQIFGQDAVSAINGTAIQEAIRRAVGPTLNRFEQRDRQEQANVELQQRVADFVAQHPYAGVHGPQIDALVGAHQELSPTAAYYEIRSFAERHGLDFTQPLGPQIEAKRAQNGQGARNGQQRGQQQQQQQARPAAPGGFRPAANVQGDNVQQRSQRNGRDFGVKEPWKDIAAAVFAEVSANQRN